MHKKLLIALLYSIFISTKAVADDTSDLLNMSLDSLSNLDFQVYSASKSLESIMDTNASTYVLNNEDIRRSPYTSVAEALRMVPGLEVSKANPGLYAITSRGFNNEFADQLLVLVDGRTVYSPIISGTYWSLEDMALENIDRIEVIKGSGGTLWGANAVSGVINIITKEATDNDKDFISGTGGKGVVASGTAQKTLKFKDTNARIYAKQTKLSNPYTVGGIHSDYTNDSTVYNFRTDKAVGQDKFHLSAGHAKERNRAVGNFVDPNLLQLATENVHGSSENNFIISSMERKLHEGNDIKLQLFADKTKVDIGIFHTLTDTYDYEFQNNIKLAKNSDFVWGFGSRFVNSKITSSNDFFYSDHPVRHSYIHNLFAQNKFTIIPEKFFLTIGSKFEYNDYTKFAMQPNVRALYKPTKDQTIWGSVSRSVRTPSLAERDVYLVNYTQAPSDETENLPLFATVTPTAKLKNESSISYEIGYRNKMNSRSFIDISTFYSQYKNLIEQCQEMSFADAQLVEYQDNYYLNMPFYTSNCRRAKTWGAEIAPTFDITDDLRIKLGITLFKINVHSKFPLTDSSGLSDANHTDPKSQLSFISYYNFNEKLSFTGQLYKVGQFTTISSYSKFDAKLSYKFNNRMQFSIAGQDIFGRKKVEYTPAEIYLPAKITPSYYAGFSINF